jgi:threonine/homoserine/homoserine lactone efflux protein
MVGMHPFLEGVIAGYGIAIPVGAVAILIINTAMQRGFRIGIMAGAGAASADFLYALLASIAGVALTAALQPVARPLRILGGLVLVGIALAGLWQGVKRKEHSALATQEGSLLKTYFQFLAITILNPLTIVYFTAYIIGRDFTADDYSLQSVLLFVAGAGLSSLSWQILLALVGGAAGKRLSSRWQLLTSLAGNLLVLALGLRILLTAFRG